jgi:hypothetical protein
MWLGFGVFPKMLLLFVGLFGGLGFAARGGVGWVWLVVIHAAYAMGAKIAR